MNEVFEELRSALYSVWHRRWLALAVAWGVCILGWLVVAMIPNSYESRARIYVDLDDVLSEQIGIAGDGRQEIQRVRQTLASSVNLEKVIRSTRLGDGITERSDMDNAIADLTKKVSIKSEEDNLFELVATVGKSDLSDAENAVLARDVVQKLIDIFREQNIVGNRNEVAGTIVFLDQQLEERKRELEAAEQRRLAFEAQYPELIGGSTTLATKIQQSRTELRGIEGDLAAAQSALAAINGQLAGTPRTIVTAGDAGGSRGALMQAQAQLAQLRGRGLTDSHPDIVATKKQVDLLRKQVAAEGPDSVSGQPNPAYTSLVSIRAERQANMEALQARRAAIQSDVAALMASQASEPEVAAEANHISRDYEVLRKKYDELLQDREEIRLRGQVENERSSFKFDLIDPPVIPQKPAAPNRPLLLIGVLLAGIGAGIAAAFAMGQLRSTFSTAGKLERAMDLPVIGSISLTLKEGAQALQAKRLKQFIGASAGLGGVFMILLAIEFIQVGKVA
ncbi:Lipopolysaccharide biosynthesis chain length determinant protein [Altererythrobacter epoxidivorans]|uniref:Lipopolysaccharide biosynthesis chain length determinant protein n=1 Tax=Altererythrobacter epoxidivorans TaxID=361183 RepID=A0A0M3TA81_9SPHN|nr:XrtA system polysaccharide chain length determinant [Altererythrobacter epoxidivorans]ALE16592.1 Lipopolysaccharide biosynthesis chain length determinant protein [Altererythrobacter epoxidivorans]